MRRKLFARTVVESATLNAASVTAPAAAVAEVVAQAVADAAAVAAETRDDFSMEQRVLQL
jgi:hypothetical protein